MKNRDPQVNPWYFVPSILAKYHFAKIGIYIFRRIQPRLKTWFSAANYKILFFSLIFIISLFGFGEIASAAGASVYVYPGSGEFKEDEEFTISVIVKATGKEVIGVVEGNLSLDNLICQGPRMVSNGIYPAPNDSGDNLFCDNPHFSLGILSGLSPDESKTLFTLKVRTASSGNASANLLGIKVAGEGPYFSDSDIAISSGSYTITPSCVCGKWSSWQNGECNEGGCDKKRVQVRTRSCEPAGCDIGSETRCIEDSACVPKPEPKITIATPTGLSGYFNPDKKTILISWEASLTKDISGYFILRKLSSETYYKLIGTVSNNALNYEDDSIEMEKTYDYSVVAFKGRSWNNSTRSGFSTKTTIEAKEVEEELIKEVEAEETEAKEEKYSAKIPAMEVEEEKTPWLSFFGLAFAALSIGGLVYYWKWQEKKLRKQKAAEKVEEVEKIEKFEENDIIDLRKFKNK